jgi:hypothetical protein
MNRVSGHGFSERDTYGIDCHVARGGVNGHKLSRHGGCEGDTSRVVYHVAGVRVNGGGLATDLWGVADVYSGAIVVE